MRKSCKREYEKAHPYMFADYVWGWTKPGNGRWVKRLSHKALRREAKKEIEKW